MLEWQMTYYATAAACIAAYLGGVWLLKLPLLTFSSVNYFLAAALAILPGYGASLGRHLPVSLERGFDQTLYFIYLIFAVVLTGATLLGQALGRRHALIGRAYADLGARVGLVLVFIFIYAAAYFYWVPHVPLMNLLMGSADLAGAAEQRIAITHQLGEMGSNLPWPFRFWRTVLQFCPALLCFYMAFSRHFGVRLSRVTYWLCLGMTMMLVTFTLEKILVVQFVFGLLIIGILGTRNIRLGRLTLIGACCVFLAMGTIAVFMGGQVSDLLGALVDRVNEQTSSTYVQIQYVRDHGFLGFSGVKFPLGSLILGPDYYVDLGREAYTVIFPERTAAGFIGSAAGLSLADLYFAFGWFGVPIFGVMIALYGWLDIMWRNGLSTQGVDVGFKRISGAYYVFGMSLLSLTFVSSVFLILSPPFGLSAQCLLLAIPYVFFVRIRSLRLLKLQ
jgi:hypothetical protein